MKQVVLFSFLFLSSLLSLCAQVPKLWIEAPNTSSTIFDDGFEDMTLSPFNTTGPVLWTITDSRASEGVFSAVAGRTNTGFSSLTITLSVPPNTDANLSFDVFRSGGGSREFLVDGQVVLNLNTQDDWTSYNYQLSTGSHDLEWRYSGNKNMRLDAVRLILTNNLAIRIQDGNQGSGKILTSDDYGNASWQDLDRRIVVDTTDQSGTQILFEPDSAGVHCSFDSTTNDSIGLLVMHAPKIGVASFCANTGFESHYSNHEGFRSINAGGDGYFAANSTGAGFRAVSGGLGFSATNSTIGFGTLQPSLYGFIATGSGDIGFISQQSANDGFVSDQSGDHGFSALNSGADGFISQMASGNGFVSMNSSQDGFYSENDTLRSYVSLNPGTIGFYSENAGTAGFTSVFADDDGFYATLSDGDGYSSHNNAGSGVTSTFNVQHGIYSAFNTADEGYFSGTVTVTGNLSKGGGSFKIDHPLDPENKYLYHSFVESPDMMNVYNGNIVLDEKGEANVTLPEYFEVLNRDFRYQLTCIGGYAQIYISQKLKDNRFAIAGGSPGLEVSWQITGIRQDPYANQNRIKVEVEKEEEFKGQFIHPEAYNKPFEKGFDYIKMGKKSLSELKQKEN